MAKWNEYTTKSAVEDTDELMIADATASVNKRTPLSILWNWIVSKLTSAVIANLETNSKSVVGALNELNSNRSFTPMITYDGTKPLSEFCKDIVKTNNAATIYVKSSYKTDITGFPLGDGCYVTTYKSATPGYAVYCAITNKGARFYCIEDGGNFSKWEAMK